MAKKRKGRTKNPKGIRRRTSRRRRAQRKRLAEKYGWICQICGLAIDPEVTTGPWRVTVDHIVPWGKGGSNDDANAQLAHKQCNERKGSKEQSLHKHIVVEDGSRVSLVWTSEEDVSGPVEERARDSQILYQEGELASN